MKIYLASSWRNDLQPGVVACLRAEGHEVYDFRNPTVGYPNPNQTAHGFHWSEIDDGWQAWNPARYREALQHPLSQQGFLSDWQAMEWADAGVLLLPSGRSAHLEAGYFVGAGKPLHILMYPDVGPSIQIPLTKGFQAIVSERDGVLAEHKWHVHPSKRTFYAARSVGPKGDQKTIFLHRVIMDAPDGIDVDHVDGDGLNCRRENLRLATRAQNIQNNHVTTGRIPYRGVFEDKNQPGHFRAAIRDSGQRTYLGSFATPEDAARAYDDAAIRMHGSFARVNFPSVPPAVTPELMYRMANSICLSVDELVAAVDGAPYVALARGEGARE